MNTRLLAHFLLCAGVAFAQEGSRPLTEAEKAMIEPFQKEARANFVTACMNVTREAARKKLTIYAITRPKMRTTKLGDYEVEILFHPELAKEHKEVSGAYYAHHNNLMLTFAAAEFAAGKKEFGIGLVEILVSAQPEMWWSMPNHPTTWVKDILKGLKKHDESVRKFLEEGADDWQYRMKTYGP
jgi:hypothetical protein